MTDKILVKDVMWQDVDIVNTMDTVKQALDKMQYKKTKLLIVDKEDENDEYGLVIVGDIASEVIAQNKSLDRINIYEIMQKPILSVHKNMDVKHCARLLTRFNLSRCPVIEDNKVIGVVSLTNIVFRSI